MKTCAFCKTSFEIYPEESVFYKTMGVPEPTLCREDRQRRRLAWRNERNLYHRKCDLTGKQIISMYAADKPFPVFSPEAWFGDQWDPRDQGQEFDFSRPFFEQFNELQKKVPRLSLISSNNENCDFCNIVGDSKNCYLIYGSVYCEDCYYGTPFLSKNCVDSLLVRNSEICYECVDCEHLYNCYFCQDCSHSQNLYFCFDVHNSHDCFLSVGLNQKSYCILNKQYSKEEYELKIKEIRFGSHETITYLKKQFEILKQKSIHRSRIGLKNENVLGDHIYESKNCRTLFYGEKCEEVSYASQILKSNHCYDCDYGEFGEYLYEVSGYYKIGNSLFTHWSWDQCSSLTYCSSCTLGTKDCFGSISLKRNQYCILNKQYTKQEYEKLVPKIIEHMKKTGEWGEFFPIELSPFSYNETLAQDYYPAVKKEALAKGWKWREDEEIKSYKGPVYEIPDAVQDVVETIIKEILICEKSEKPFKIIPQELKFYQEHNLPIPRLSPNQRHLDRIRLRNPMKLFDRRCGKNGELILTTYAPDRPEKIFCDECYLKTVY